jgi:hypothetical protein
MGAVCNATIRIGVISANALVPGSDEIAVTAQRRDWDQSELIIDYVLGVSAATSTAALLLGSLAAGMVLWVMRIGRS